MWLPPLQLFDKAKHLLDRPQKIVLPFAGDFRKRIGSSPASRYVICSPAAAAASARRECGQPDRGPTGGIAMLRTTKSRVSMLLAVIFTIASTLVFAQNENDRNNGSSRDRSRNQSSQQ